MRLTPHSFAEKFPHMNATDFDALVADIKANGQHEPIVIFEGKVLDGRHREAACAQLGIEPICKTFDGDAVAARLLAASLNVHRRHLNREQRRELIVSELKRDSTQSDRVIAEKAKVNHETVGHARRKLEAGGGIRQSDKRVGKNGVEKPVLLNKRGRRIVLPEIKRSRPSNGMDFARMAIFDLQQITRDDVSRIPAFNHVRTWLNENEA